MSKEDTFDFIKKKYSCDELEGIIYNEILSVKQWEYISEFQNLSEDFILKYRNKIKWTAFQLNRSIILSDSFCELIDNELMVDYDCGLIDCTCDINTKNYIVNWKYHRTLGPAKIYKYNSSANEYWYRGRYLENIRSMEEFKHWLNLRIFD
jgi:hypothetical protein